LTVAWAWDSGVPEVSAPHPVEASITGSPARDKTRVALENFASRFDIVLLSFRSGDGDRPAQV
jgi:hypothetical protein